MNGYRTYRFPPLLRAAASGLPPAAAGTASEAQWHDAVRDGFRQGVDDGYLQGHTQGLAEGRAEGLQSGHAEGLAQGRAQARDEVLASFEGVAAPVDALLDALKRLRADYKAAQRKEMVELVARVARQVIRCELTLQPVQLLALVDETLATLPPTRKGVVEVFLNPDDLQRIRDIDPKRFKRWSLIADPRLQAGECHVKAGDHEVDAGCNQRLSACMEKVSTQLIEAEPLTAEAEVHP